ncbi:proline--tRNA ligase [Senegalia massiliensis]|uniref:proline--tRNA ligase n=1 Tax=Senegalia massiliensis TaxID=1720316 RepID=UPI001030E085|nr:proline--tRNA ligase [Senegalia massiliensis]
MKMSRLYMPTLREVPADAEIPSHKLLLRAGMIRKLVSGVYSYLPLGFRVIEKIEKIVREEMDRAGSQEVLMSAIQPRELWEESGRWADFGPEMFRLKDRNEREFCLGPTHEEIFTDLIRNELKSYKQLPLNIYQIQTKYRDEKRPRFGVMRSREFIMKDAYSFDKDVNGMNESYMDMWRAYEKAFTRCNLNFRVVEGDSGAMGDGDSHEFTAMSSVGESEIAYCKDCDYAATDEKAKVIYSIDNKGENLEIEEVHTPGIKTIENLVEFFGIDASNFVKTLLVRISDEVIAVLIPGDRELNHTKLVNYFKVPEHELEMLDEEGVRNVTGAEVGFAGPIDLKQDIKILMDSRVKKMKNFIIGANKTDYHIKNVNIDDISAEEVEDLLLVKENDECPKCGSELLIERGIEVGNIFQLGTKYSDGLDATFLDENGKSTKFWMGSYGIGITRTMAAIIEQYHDDKGIIWPLSVAPYHVIITVVNAKKDDQMELGEKLYNQLMDKGIEVLIDDRKERAGVKFTDAELIGIPIRITVGRDAKESVVEFSVRGKEDKIKINSNEIFEKVQEAFNEQGLKL